MLSHITCCSSQKTKANDLETRQTSTSNLEDCPETSNNIPRTSKKSKKKNSDVPQLAVTPEMVEELPTPAEWSDGAVTVSFTSNQTCS